MADAASNDLAPPHAAGGLAPQGDTYADRLARARERLERSRAGWSAELRAADARRADRSVPSHLWPLFLASLRSHPALRWLQPVAQAAWPVLKQLWRDHPLHDGAHRLAGLARTQLVPQMRRHPVASVAIAAGIGALAALTFSRWRAGCAVVARRTWRLVRGGLAVPLNDPALQAALAAAALSLFRASADGSLQPVSSPVSSPASSPDSPTAQPPRGDEPSPVTG